MRKFPFDPGNVQLYWTIFPFACALAVVGAKCWAISVYASPTPFWDQWDGEAASVYQPYFAGTLRLSDLIVPHNEHRILITRLWSLLLLELNGYWDPILQMVANTLLAGLTVALLIAAFRPMLDTVSWIVLALFSMIIFALPLAWENILSGFHSQWYFLNLVSLAGLILLLIHIGISLVWLLAGEAINDNCCASLALPQAGQAGMSSEDMTSV
ncbi:MAG: hypothetical protein HY244_19620 [Rhizobiales bacterium]|nr:hypothetical protein [Hyphomicrobiales bacterium]